MKVGILHTAFLGDLVLSGLLIDGLHKAGHEIFLITNMGGKLIFQHDPRIKNISVVKKGKGLKKLQNFKIICHELNALKIEVLLVPHRSINSSLIAKFSKIKTTIGYKNAAFSFLYNTTIPFINSRHECLRLLDLAPDWLIPNQIKNELEKDPYPILETRNQFTKFSVSFPTFLETNKDFFIIALGSIWKTKIYPSVQLAKVARKILTENKSIYCILSSGPSDHEEVKAFMEEFNSIRSNFSEDLSSRLLDATSCLPLPELVSITALAKFVIANDSAPLHIASGVNVPVIGIYGPTSFETGFGPIGKNTVAINFSSEHNFKLECQPCSSHGHVSCPKKHHKCMRELSANFIVDTCKKIVPNLFR